jgi:hypothetical protein
MYQSHDFDFEEPPPPYSPADVNASATRSIPTSTSNSTSNPTSNSSSTSPSNPRTRTRTSTSPTPPFAHSYYDPPRRSSHEVPPSSWKTSLSPYEEQRLFNHPSSRSLRSPLHSPRPQTRPSPPPSPSPHPHRRLHSTSPAPPPRRSPLRSKWARLKADNAARKARTVQRVSTAHATAISGRDGRGYALDAEAQAVREARGEMEERWRR